jgi:C1A family cysteine protease
VFRPIITIDLLPISIIMKFTLATLAAGATIAAASPERFAEYKKTYTKKYESPLHEKKAYYSWLQNDKIIKETNAKGLSYKLGHNEFSDLSREEFAAQYTMAMPKSMMRGSDANVDYTLSSPERVASNPASVDWAQKGAVTAIKNQGQCGSCWSFSTTGSVEGAYQIATGTLKSFSEQQLVSCDKVDDGCQGGLMDNAFKYIEENGICTEESYPYKSGTGNRGTCEKTCTAAATVTSFTDVASKDENALETAVAQAPVSVAIEADKSVFQLYKSGVMNSKSCGTNLDHGVLAVGYGTQDGNDYWKVKNSWGESWGMNGFILLGKGENICGISQQPSYPTGVKPAGPPGPSPPSPSPPSPSPPGPSPPSSSHYEDPNKGGCQSDEVDIQITGVSGSVCSPKCTGIFKTKCPTDVPAGVTAEPECALQDASDNSKYCALICSPSTDEASLRAGDAQCSTNASCKAVPNASVGLCTYDS